MTWGYDSAVGVLAAHSGGGSGSSKRFPSILRELENLEDRKRVLGFDLEGVMLSMSVP